MNWKLVSKPAAAIQEYHLSDGDSRKLILKYNPLHQSARINHGAFNRLFYIEKAGQLSNKTLFKDQYGMETGSLVLDKWSENHASIVIENEKYNCRLINNTSPEIIIYNNDPGYPLVRCFLNTTELKAGILNNSFLVLSLCMYLVLPVVNESYSAVA